MTAMGKRWVCKYCGEYIVRRSTGRKLWETVSFAPRTDCPEREQSWLPHEPRTTPRPGKNA